LPQSDAGTSTCDVIVFDRQRLVPFIRYAQKHCFGFHDAWTSFFVAHGSRIHDLAWADIPLVDEFSDTVIRSPTKWSEASRCPAKRWRSFSSSLSSAS